jgi:hypothetical protein
VYLRSLKHIVVYLFKYIFTNDQNFPDNWLKQIKEKPKKKVKQKSRNGSPSVQDETSMDALVAAGLNVNTLAWNKPATVVSTAVKATPIAESSGKQCNATYHTSMYHTIPCFIIW